MSIVRLSGVSKSYGRTQALRDVDLTLGTGVTGLLGPNGAGKTTLLRVLATSIAADAGRMTMRGMDPRGSQEEVTEIRRHLGYLPQELGFPTDMTPYGFVEYLAVLKEWNHAGRRAAEVRRVLELVDLTDLAAKRISRLSGGQRRRVALAQALVGEPDLVVLDEPTTGLDPEQRATLRRTLSVAGRDSAVLLSTHQTEDVAALCERVVGPRAGDASASTGRSWTWWARPPGRSGSATGPARRVGRPGGPAPGVTGSRRARPPDGGAGRADPRGRLPAHARRPALLRQRSTPTPDWRNAMTTTSVGAGSRSQLAVMTRLESAPLRAPPDVRRRNCAGLGPDGAHGGARGRAPSADVLSTPVVAAFFIGLFSLVAAARLTRSTESAAEAVATAPGSEATRTAALALACFVPFSGRRGVVGDPAGRGGLARGRAAGVVVLHHVRPPALEPA